MKSTNWILLCLCSVLLAACKSPLPVNDSTRPEVAATAMATVIVPSPVPTLMPPLITFTPTPTSTVAASTMPAAVVVETHLFSWPPPLPAKAGLSRDRVTAAQQSTFDQLVEQLPVARDDIALVAAYGNIGPTVDIFSPAAVAVPPPLGSRQQFQVRNLDTNTNSFVEAELLATGEHAYFWFDTQPGSSPPDAARLELMRDAFDEIYVQINRVFGSEDNPGIDGDARIHILHVSPVALCDVTVANLNECGKLGMFSAWDHLPLSVNPHSNEREMFVMNAAYFSNPDYLGVLAHEFRHMVESNYDTNDIDWEVEGSAMLAKELVGFPEDSIRRANVFLANPDQQLNRWTEGSTTPYYGQSYLLNRYLYERLGPELYLDFARHPAPGLQAIDELAQTNDFPFDGHSLWLDWLVAMAIHNEPGRPAIYSLPVEIGVVAMAELGPGPAVLETTVGQYAADYYRIWGEGDLTLSFTGSHHARLMPLIPASGELMWLANRANFSQMRLTREFDLRAVNQATLNYQVYFSIEQGYDFAYLSVSTDGGHFWQALTAPNMRGMDGTDNPGEIALANRFYTGNSQDWLTESIDLSPYAGQLIHLRFEYVTDPILTLSGIAFDSISIPEIGFYDGAETEMGWTAEGFLRATGYVPQVWALQLITWSDGEVQIEQLELNSDQTITRSVSPGTARWPATLIVAALAPMTLEPAYYQLRLH